MRCFNIATEKGTTMGCYNVDESCEEGTKMRCYNMDESVCVGFHTGTVQVGPDDTTPAPLDTAPLQGWGTHRTHFFKVLMLNQGSI
jgi:hypothetical protein